jgi:hypothetical protein
MQHKTLLIIASAAVARAQLPIPFTAVQISTGASKGCPGVQTTSLEITEDAMSWKFNDFIAEEPGKTEGFSNCGMYNSISAPPSGKRFAIRDVTYSGDATFENGGYGKSLATVVDLNIKHLVDVVDGKEKWAYNKGDLGIFEAVNVTLGDGDSHEGRFEATGKKTKPGKSWSPCSIENQNSYTHRYQFYQNTFVYTGVDGEESYAKIGKGLQVDVNLEWEDCTPAEDEYSKWGNSTAVPDNCQGF